MDTSEIIMTSLLLLTDMPVRGERLAKSLNLIRHTVVADVLDPDTCERTRDLDGIGVIISDVSFSQSSTVAALRSYIDRVRRTRANAEKVPYLCLLHDDTSRGNATAQALGAMCVLRADQAGYSLVNALGSMLKSDPAGSASIAADVASADAALTRIFEIGRSGGVIAPELIESGAEFIKTALSKADVQTWLEVVWRFDDITHQHCLLVAGLAAGFAKELGFNGADCKRLTKAALLHDIGKSRIPVAVLNKVGRLDEDEQRIIRTHPAVGYDMLVEHGYSAELLAVVRSHHEYLDGTGYPDRLSGRDIPDLVRLATICDIYAALIERRPYKEPMGAGQAYTILTNMQGKLDPVLLEAFRTIAVSIR